MDARLRTAVDASLGWYEDLCALHGIASVLLDGLWSAVGPSSSGDLRVWVPAAGA